MTYPRWTLGTLILLSWVTYGAGQADEPQLLPRAGVLVLVSGNVLRGDILRVGDRYIVTLGVRDEVTVGVSQVEMHCASLEEAYQRKRGFLPANAQVHDHLELADWCLRYDLLAAAAEQLMAAQSQAPLDPANERFEKRLRLAAQRCAATPDRGGDAAPIVSPDPPAEQEQLTRNLPPGTVAQFTNTIQPLLINRCGASACHGPNSNSAFRLVFPHASRALPRRFTQRNLQAALNFLDSDRPEHSPLLQMATTAHGGTAGASLAPQDSVPRRHLAGWVRRAARGNSADSSTQGMAADESDVAPPEPANPIRNGLNASDGDGRVASHDAAPMRLFDPAVRPANHTEAVPNASDPRPSKDPFDPETFNRRYLPPGR